MDGAIGTAASTVELLHWHGFCGLGGGGKGFNKGQARVGRTTARFRCIGGVDSDPAAIADFSRAAGVPGTVLDLFDREQYEAFHGREPPAGWRPATTADIRASAGGESPNIIFLSAPCKGFSGLLAEAKSASPKYQALNGLTLRGIMLALEAFADDPAEFVIFENVPRIQRRGRFLLDRIVAVLRSHGYAVAETTHDCGVLGGLAQTRKRFLLVARHMAKVPPFLYEPPKRALRGVGEILERLPLPGDPAGGPMHRMPALQWKTWVRLAFVQAGSDWRSLNRLAVQDGVLRDFAIAPVGVDGRGGWNRGVLGVQAWSDTSGTVTGRGAPTTGNFAVADPRVDGHVKSVQLGVRDWGRSAPTVKGDMSVGGGPYAVADPRGGHFRAGTGVTPWDGASAPVAGESLPSNGRFAVADPRTGWPDSAHQNLLKVAGYDGSAGTVTGARHPAGGAQSVADPRIPSEPQDQVLGVQGWEGPAKTLSSKSGPTNGAYSVADPRTGWPASAHQNKLKVVGYDGSAGTVTGSDRVGSGAQCVADPRPAGWPERGQLGVAGWPQHIGAITSQRAPGQGKFAVADPRGGATGPRFNNVYRVVRTEDTAPSVTGGTGPTAGGLAVADPRAAGGFGGKGKYQVVPIGGQANTVIAASTTGHGACAVADPRTGLDPARTAYRSGGHYGVKPWAETSAAVTAAGQHDNGPWAVADPRCESEGDDLPAALPAAEDRLVAVIVAEDGTWHRPFTTLELAALQSLVDPEDFAPAALATGEGGAWSLAGTSDSAWRERIGNAVPPDSAQVIASVMGQAILLARAGETFQLSAAPIWVRPFAVAVSVDDRQPVWEVER